MRSKLISTLVLGGALVSQPAVAEAPSLDDMTPHHEGGSQEVSGNAEVQGQTVEAEALQVGANRALERIMDGDDGNGLYEIDAKSGFAVLAAATEGYGTYQAKDATLLSKRAAYVNAYHKALQRLIRYRDGLMSSCMDGDIQAVQTATTGASETLGNVTQETRSRCQETVEGMVRGAVIFAVKDDTDARAVTVAVAASDKTRSAPSRLNAAVTEAEDPEKAWNQLVEELRLGVLPPMGARLITAPDSGEQVGVGFGSAIVRHNTNPAVARKLKGVAKQQARMRANNALVGFLKGSEVYWQGGFEERQVQETLQFDPAVFDEMAQAQEAVTETSRALASIARGYQEEGVAGAAEATADELDRKAGEPRGPQVEPYAQARERFLNMMEHKEERRAVTKGRLPPGVRQKAFVGEDGNWAFAFAVYSAAAEERARELASQASSRGSKRGAGEGGETQAEGGTDFQMQGGVDEDAENPEGPTGQVTSPSDL